MNNYDELIDKLSFALQLGDAPIMKGSSILVEKTTIKEAINAIKRLIKERDAASTDLKEFVDCDMCKNNTDECLNSGFCKECSVGKSTRDSWEWRGIPENDS